MIALLVALVLPFCLLRLCARRVARSPGEPTDRLHRLRIAMLAGALPLLPLLVLAQLERPLDERLLGRAAPWAVIIALPVVILASLVGAYLAVRPVYEELRGIRGTTERGTRRLTRQLVVVLAPQAGWIAVLIWLGHSHASPVVTIAVVVVFLVSLPIAGPILVRAAIPTREPPREVAERVKDLCAAHGVRIRGVRVIDTRHDPAVNAVFSGFGPGPKYVFLTDRLLDTFTEDELAAVFAHEIAHRKKHHIAIKLAAQLAVTLVIVAVVVVVALTMPESVPAAVLAVPVPILLLAAVLFVRGRLGIRLEQQADDYAAATVGAQPLRQALDKLAEANMLKRRTGKLWNLLQQHPGLQARLDRLDSV